MSARRPGLNVYTSEDGTSTAQVDLGITAADLSSALALLVPAGSRLTRITSTKKQATLRFRPQR